MIAGNLTTKEIEKHTDAVALIPFGSFEQHGPFLPLLTDSIIAEEIAKRVEQERPESVLLYPTLWFGDSIEHKDFPGTLSDSAISMMHTLENLFTYFELSGFKRGILYNAHGGNVNLANTICEEFSREHHFKAWSLFAYTRAVKEVSKELFSVAETHAGSTEISLVYSLRPDLKRTDETMIENDQPYPGGGKLAFYKTSELSRSGVLHKADKIEINIEKGNQLAAAMTAALREAVEKMLELN